MAWRTRKIASWIIGTMLALAFAALSQTRLIEAPIQSTPKDQFVRVNGVRLNYLDWGGSGEALLFLTSLGGSARDFQPLAIQLTDRFHVLGLTRRGQGLSDKPDTGYDTSTLTEDVKAFLDIIGIARVTLAGYSLAGNELTEFAGLYPKKIAKLIYLDAAYDLAENKELGKNLHLPPMRGDNATLQLIARSNEYHPDYSRIKAPALGFFVTYDEPPQNESFDEQSRKKLLTWWYEYGKPYRREQIERFKTGVKHSKIVELHNTTHGGFIFEPKQQAILLEEMRKFLFQ